MNSSFAPDLRVIIVDDVTYTVALAIESPEYGTTRCGKVYSFKSKTFIGSRSQGNPQYHVGVISKRIYKRMSHDTKRAVVGTTNVAWQRAQTAGVTLVSQGGWSLWPYWFTIGRNTYRIEEHASSVLSARVYNDTGKQVGEVTGMGLCKPLKTSWENATSARRNNN